MGLMLYSEKSFTKIVPTMLSNSGGLGEPLVSLLCVVIITHFMNCTCDWNSSAFLALQCSVLVVAHPEF